MYDIDYDIDHKAIEKRQVKLDWTQNQKIFLHKN